MAKSIADIRDEHFNHLIDIKTRINELVELERQWEKLFEVGKKSLEYDFSLSIRGRLFYTTYFYDKFNILTSDLYTLLSGQVIDQKSFIQSIPFNVRVKSEDEYYDPCRKINIAFLPGTFLPPDMEAFKDERRRESAKRTYNLRCRLFKEIFPELDPSEALTLQRMQPILERLRQNIAFLKPFRHQYSHKYEAPIVRKNSTELEINLEAIVKIFNWYSETTNNLSILFDGKQYSFDVPAHYESNADSIIKLILFDSIEQAEFWSDTIKEESEDSSKDLSKGIIQNMANFFDNPTFVEYFVTKI